MDLHKVESNRGSPSSTNFLLNQTNHGGNTDRASAALLPPLLKSESRFAPTNSAPQYVKYSVEGDYFEFEWFWILIILVFLSTSAIAISVESAPGRRDLELERDSHINT